MRRPRPAERQLQKTGYPRPSGHNKRSSGQGGVTGECRVCGGEWYLWGLSLLISDQIFWDDGMFDMMREWLDDPSRLSDPEAQRIMVLSPAAERHARNG
jgi:hypothetical protein